MINYINFSKFNNFRKWKEYQPITFNKQFDMIFKILINNKWINCSLKHVLYEPIIVQISIHENFEESELNNNLIKIYSYYNPRSLLFHSIL